MGSPGRIFPPVFHDFPTTGKVCNPIYIWCRFYKQFPRGQIRLAEAVFTQGVQRGLGFPPSLFKAKPFGTYVQDPLLTGDFGASENSNAPLDSLPPMWFTTKPWGFIRGERWGPPRGFPLRASRRFLKHKVAHKRPFFALLFPDKLVGAIAHKI